MSFRSITDNYDSYELVKELKRMGTAIQIGTQRKHTDWIF